MPTDFGEITAYHREEAAGITQWRRPLATGMLRRGRVPGLSGRALDEAAREQMIVMRREPARHAAYRRPGYQSPEPRRIPFTVVCWLAIRRGIKRIALAIRQPLPKRTAPIEWLSLR